MEVYGVIYLLIDGTNDREYVGQTTRTVEERFYQHKHCDLYVDRMIQEHGEENFTAAILKVCYSQEELDYWERHFIKSRDTLLPNGYNLTKGGSGTGRENNPFFGKRHTTETKAKIAEANHGNTAWVGRHHRKDSKAKISAFRRADTPFKNLLAEMDKRQLTYKDLAEFLGLARTTFPPKMRGKYNFTSKDIAKLVEIFDKLAEYLMARDEN